MYTFEEQLLVHQNDKIWRINAKSSRCTRVAAAFIGVYDGFDNTSGFGCQHRTTSLLILRTKHDQAFYPYLWKQDCPSGQAHLFKSHRLRPRYPADAPCC